MDLPLYTGQCHAALRTEPEVTALVIDKHSKDGTLPLSVFYEAMKRAPQIYRDWLSRTHSKPPSHDPKGHKHRLPWLLPTSHSPYLDLSASLIRDRAEATQVRPYNLLPKEPSSMNFC